MFIECPIIGKMCAMCAKSNYNPMIDGYDSREHLHCGMLTGYETRINSLEKCWLDMDNKERARFRRQKKNEYYALNPNKMVKTKITY